MWLRFSTSAVRSSEEPEESIDSDGPAPNLCFFDLILPPMEEESRARSDLGGCSPEIDRRGIPYLWPDAGHGGSTGSTNSTSESLGQMGAHEGMAGEACGTLKSGRRVLASSVPIRRNQPSVGELLLGCNPEILCRVTIFGGAFFLNDSFLYLLRLLFLLLFE